MYAYTYNFAPEPFTLFILRWNGRFPHLHQNICNNHCNTATKAYHTRNQRTMVADHLQRAMVICHTTVIDVADGFQHIRHRNTLIFRCMEFRCICVCDSGWQDENINNNGYYGEWSEGLKHRIYMSWRTCKRVKGDSSTRQGALMNSSRSFHENIKILLKKSCQVFLALS